MGDVHIFTTLFIYYIGRRIYKDIKTKHIFSLMPLSIVPLIATILPEYVITVITDNDKKIHVNKTEKPSTGEIIDRCCTICVREAIYALHEYQVYLHRMGFR